MNNQKNHDSNKRDNQVSKVTVILFIFTIIVLLCILFKALYSDKISFPWSIIALFLGLLFESYFIFKKMNSTLLCFSISFFFSLIIFVPTSSEIVYNFERHVKIWPYIFMLLYVLGLYLFKRKELNNHQTEGTTLLLSLVFIYWLKDYHLFNDLSAANIILLVFIIPFTLLSLLNAFTNLNLGTKNRLLLSVWTSVILLCLAIDNAFSIFVRGDIENQISIVSKTELGLQYFFTGVSAIYFIQNLFLLFVFFPNKKIDYDITFKQAKELHLERYSTFQISWQNSIFCVLYCFTVFYFNEIYKLLPVNTIIWLVIATFPFLIKISNSLLIKNTE